MLAKGLMLQAFSNHSPRTRDENEIHKQAHCRNFIAYSRSKMRGGKHNSQLEKEDTRRANPGQEVFTLAAGQINFIEF